jgi:rubrerythrin
MADDFAKRLAELNSVAELMTLAIARERASANYYERAVQKATTEAAKKAFSLLLEQERDHEKIMRSELAVIRREIEKMRANMKK